MPSAMPSQNNPLTVAINLIADSLKALDSKLNAANLSEVDRMGLNRVKEALTKIQSSLESTGNAPGAYSVGRIVTDNMGWDSPHAELGEQILTALNACQRIQA